MDGGGGPVGFRRVGLIRGNASSAQKRPDSGLCIWTPTRVDTKLRVPPQLHTRRDIVVDIRSGPSRSLTFNVCSLLFLRLLTYIAP